MIEGGLVTLYVKDMDKSINFYTEVLGMKLQQRFGNHWASAEAPGLTIGFHPATEKHPAGMKGSMQIGLRLSRPIKEVVPELEQKGVKFPAAIEEDNATWNAHFDDPDGNALYIAELKWKR
jgi:catechol 2,3-dioxygenase-like lactoylglutathione lyase family enzyme